MFTLSFSKFLTLVFLPLLIAQYVQSQNKIDKAIDEYYDNNVLTSMDTSYINFQVKSWSLRALSTFKDHSFQLRNAGNRLTFTPNNRFGVGVGVAYFPILVDVGFNIKGGEEQTERFDLQADLVLKSSYLGLVVQDYQGFNIYGNDTELNVFREDIRSSAVQLSYGHAFNSNRLSAGSILSGAHKQKKDVGTFLLGGFLSYYQLQADSSIVPRQKKTFFGDIGGITNIQSMGAGVLGGYGHIFVLPSDFFIFANALMGLGLARKEWGDGTEFYIVSDPMLYRMNLRLSIGYNGSRFYVILTGTNDLSLTSMDFGNWGLLNIGKAKLIIGYKFMKNAKSG